MCVCVFNVCVCLTSNSHIQKKVEAEQTEQQKYQEVCKVHETNNNNN